MLSYITMNIKIALKTSSGMKKLTSYIENEIAKKVSQ